MQKAISFSSPIQENEEFRREIVASLDATLSSGNFMLGAGVRNFENSFANYINTTYCIGVGSGTDALVLSMLALGITTGDEVLVPTFTASATVVAITNVGATPVFLDIGAEDYYIDFNAIEANITARTKAIIFVHLYGSTGEIPKIKSLCADHGIFLIEDCAQAAGAKYDEKRLGSFGDLSCFSFYPTKNLSAIGDGGAVLTNNVSLAESLLRKRQYGWDENRECIESGILSRLDELQGQILLKKLDCLDNLNEKRQSIARQYDEVLQTYGFKRYGLNSAVSHANHLYVIEVVDRARAFKLAENLQINLGIHYKKSVHEHPFFKRVPQRNSLLNSEIASQRVISLPLYPQLKQFELERVLRLIEILSEEELIAKERR